MERSERRRKTAADMLRDAPRQRPATAAEPDPGGLRDILAGFERRLSTVEGKVTVIMGLAGATFLGVFALMLAQVFAS